MSLIGTANNLIIDIRWQSYFYIGFLLGKHFHFHFEQAIRDGFFFLFFSFATIRDGCIVHHTKYVSKVINYSAHIFYI